MNVDLKARKPILNYLNNETRTTVICPKLTQKKNTTSQKVLLLILGTRAGMWLLLIRRPRTPPRSRLNSSILQNNCLPSSLLRVKSTPMRVAWSSTMTQMVLVQTRVVETLLQERNQTVLKHISNKLTRFKIKMRTTSWNSSCPKGGIAQNSTKRNIINQFCRTRCMLVPQSPFQSRSSQSRFQRQSSLCGCLPR